CSRTSAGRLWGRGRDRRRVTAEFDHRQRTDAPRKKRAQHAGWQSLERMTTIGVSVLSRRRFPMRCLLSLVVLALTSSPCLAQSADLNEAEQAFADLMSGAVMVGRFSVDGRDTPPREERYEISKAQKLGGDKWLITARIKYGQNDLEVPVAVQMNWAGDTPVLSVTDITIPGLGEGFTTRLLFYKDRYAGSWYHGEAGGHMWGKIEKAEDGDDKVSQNEPDPQDRRVKQQLEERVKAKFDEAKLPEVVEYLSNATGIAITVSPDVKEGILTHYPVNFDSPRPSRLGHLLPRILRPVGLVPLIVDG